MRCVGQGHFDVEEAFGGAVAFHAEELVVPIWHFEGPRVLGACRVEIGAAVLVVAAQTAGTPDCDDGFFEFGEDALFLQCAERRIGFCAAGKSAVACLRRGTGVDGSLGVDEVVGG